MITEEEKEEIINKAVERALLMLPDTVGNLIANHVALSKLNSKFYADHPEFRDKKDIVASVSPHTYQEDSFLLPSRLPKLRYPSYL